MNPNPTRRLGTVRFRGWSLALLSGLRMWCCSELWCRSQTHLRSCIAVAGAEASSYSSYLTPSLGTSMCHWCGLKTNKQKKQPKRYADSTWSPGGGSLLCVLTSPLGHFDAPKSLENPAWDVPVLILLSVAWCLFFKMLSVVIAPFKIDVVHKDKTGIRVLRKISFLFIYLFYFIFFFGF